MCQLTYKQTNFISLCYFVIYCDKRIQQRVQNKFWTFLFRLIKDSKISKETNWFQKIMSISSVINLCFWFVRFIKMWRRKNNSKPRAHGSRNRHFHAFYLVFKQKIRHLFRRSHIDLPGCPSPTDSEVNKNSLPSSISYPEWCPLEYPFVSVVSGILNLVFRALSLTIVRFVSLWKREINICPTALL